MRKHVAGAKRTKSHRKAGAFKYDGGRQISFEGVPVLQIAPASGPYSPTAVDSLARLIATLLNKSAAAKGHARKSTKQGRSSREG